MDASLFLVCALLTALFGLLVASRLCGARTAGGVLAASTFALVLSWPEVALRAAGYRGDRGGIIQFGYPTPEILLELPKDPELFWRLPPFRHGTNSLGFVGPEFEIPKPDRVFRIVFLGDSVTQQGYPALVADELNRAGGDPHFDSVNLGVSGYTSHQGLVLARRWTQRLEPDLVVVNFGWNDHWRVWGATDAERKNRAPKPVFDTLFGRSRLLRWMAERWAHTAGPLDAPRVPVEEFRANLKAIGHLARSAGAQVMLVTAPSMHPKTGVPEYLLERRFAADAAQALRRHARYAQIVRRVSRDTGWILFDAEQLVRSVDRYDEAFKEDGIHLNKEGLLLLARDVSRVVGRHFRDARGGGLAAAQSGPTLTVQPQTE